MRTLGQLIEPSVYAAELTESPIEAELFWAMMRHPKFVLVKGEEKPEGAGIFVRPQTPIGPYIADFYILGRGYGLRNLKLWPPKEEFRLVVECDGKDWHTSQEQREYDNVRDAYMTGMGITVKRFTGSEIHKNTKYCVDQIENIIFEAVG